MDDKLARRQGDRNATSALPDEPGHSSYGTPSNTVRLAGAR